MTFFVQNLQMVFLKYKIRPKPGSHQGGITTALDYIGGTAHTTILPPTVLREVPNVLPPLNLENIKSVFSWFERSNGKRFTIDFSSENKHIPRGALYLPPHFSAAETFLIPCSIAKYQKGWSADDVGPFYPIRLPTDTSWFNPWIEGLGAEPADQHTVSRSSIGTAIGLEYVIFMEAAHNRSHKMMKPKSGAIRIAARAQIMRDALSIAQDLGELWGFAEQQGITGWRLNYLHHNVDVIREDVALVPTNVSYYPLIHIPANKAVRGLGVIMGKQPLNFLELIAHEISLQAEQPILSIALGKYTGVRDVLGDEYAQKLAHIRMHARSLDDLSPLLDHPAFQKGTGPAYSDFYAAVRRKTEELMDRAYAKMTWNMDHACLMAIERHVAEGNGPISREELLGMVGDAAKVIIRSGERYLPHLSEGNIKILHSGYLTPAAEHSIEHLKRADILQPAPSEGWGERFSINENTLHYEPEGSVRMLNSTELVRNDLRRFQQVLQEYGLSPHLRV
jgi:hypothetical protein